MFCFELLKFMLDMLIVFSVGCMETDGGGLRGNERCMRGNAPANERECSEWEK